MKSNISHYLQPHYKKVSEVLFEMGQKYVKPESSDNESYQQQ